MKNFFCFIFLSLVLVIGTVPVSVMASHQASPMFRGMHQTRSSALSETPSNSAQNRPDVVIMTHPQAFYGPLHKINKHYQKIVRRIAQSSLSQPARNLLLAQANESRCLAIKQAHERLELRAKHLCQRIPFQCELMQDKKTRKLLKKIDKM